MEFIVLVGGVVIMVPVVALILSLNLLGRVRKLEQSIKSGVPQRVSVSSAQPQSEQLSEQLPAAPWLDPSDPVNQAVAQPVAVPLQTGSTSFDRFSEWLKEDWLMKLGALLLLIGFGWLTTYAFLNDWIGPMGRIALGIIAGALFLALGWWRMKKYIHQGGIFLVLGSTTILLTIFAAREVYDFFDPVSALAVMFLSTAFVAFVSVRYNSRSLALASLILAGIAPLLTNSPSTDYVSLFAYLFIVIIGAIWIAVITGRRELTTAALILIGLYSLPHLLSSPSGDTSTLLLFVYAFAAVFFITNTAGILKLRDKEIVSDLVTAAGNGLFLLAWIMTAAPNEWKSLIISAWMIVFAVGAFMIFKITQRREPFYVYIGVGIAMLAAATSAELEGATLTIAYTIESGIIALISYLVLKDIKVAQKMSLLLIGPVILSFGSFASRSWKTSVVNDDFFVLLILGSVLLGLGLFFLHRAREVGDEESKQFNSILLIAGSVYAYALLWLSLGAGLEDKNTAVMISLVVYTIIGLISYFYGLVNKKNILRLYGGVLIGVVVGRLFLVDIWNMELAGRIVIFFLIGALLISTAFLGKKKRDSSLSNNTQ